MPFVQPRDIRIHYFEEGDPATAREVVVFTHGLRRSARAWQLVQKALPDGYYSVSPDNRGSGLTDAPPREADYSIKLFADDLFDLGTALDLPPFTLVGGSDGGATAMHFAVDHPGWVKALVLVDPTDPDGHLPTGMTVEAFVDKRTASWHRLRQSILDGQDSLVPAATPAEFRKALLNDIVTAPERRFRGATRSMATLRIGDRVSSLPMPVLLMTGDRVPLDKTRATLAKLPEGTYLQIVHAAGHALNVEVPAETAAILQRFVERVVPAK